MLKGFVSLRQMYAFLIFITVGFSAVASTAEKPLAYDFPVTLPSLEQLSSLTVEQQDIYWLGLRSLILEIQEVEGLPASYYSSHDFFLKFINEAYAAEGERCIFAGFLQFRVAGKCEAPPACVSNPKLIQCSPLLYGPDVCVSKGDKATISCEASARNLNKIREYRNANPRSWAAFQLRVQEYCAKGKQASICRLIRARLDEMRRTTGVPEKIPSQMPVERVGSGVGRFDVGAGAVLAPKANSNSGDHGGCLSEMLVQGVRISGRETKQLIEPEVVFRAFCQGDINYLKSEKSGMLQKVQKALEASRKAVARVSLVERKRLEQQNISIKQGYDILRRCIAHIESGKVLPSKRAGTIDFEDNGMIVKLQSNGRERLLDTLNFAFGMTIITSAGNPGARFCDYSLISRKAASSTPIPTNTTPSDK